MNPEFEKENVAVLEEEVSAAPVDARKVFSMASQIQTIKLAREEMRANGEKVTEEVPGLSIDLLLERAKSLGYNAETVKTIKPEDLETIYADVDLDIKVEADRAADFKTGVLQYFLQTEEVEAELDAELIKINEFMQEQAIELDALNASFESVDSMLDASIDAYEAEATTEEAKANIAQIRATMHDGLTLENIYNGLVKHGHENVLSDYFRRGDAVYGRFLQFAKRVGVENPDRILTHEKFEEKFLPEAFHKYPNLVLFTVIRHLAYSRKSATRQSEGVFFARLMINLKALYSGSLSEAKQAEMVAGAERILNLFGLRNETTE